MDESDFQITRGDVTLAADRCGARHANPRTVTHPSVRRVADLSYLSGAGEFGEHAWDEGGHA
ncbi:hypothetical protein HMPREF0063_10952 [Aeromicrobium marinum DSM 15272]|uniref:Uncharacterized protein n=1 Tax=Aeromicrobium marinum DSM 15272 TaxID=585531 RepID=E2SAG2_9ACTN|nr:hypothetical protein [Aeromicrobium marinum]EFQ84236.1 hypothetical protein HMPREF0063_10952 [Aeromicrobium marinum DSM 15272]